MTFASDIADRFFEDASHLWIVRDQAVRAPHYSLPQLAELDERLDAHLDGVRVSGDDGAAAVAAGVEIGEPGEIFVAALVAFERGDAFKAGLGKPESRRALISALGWLPPALAAARARTLLASDNPSARFVGLAGLLAHRLDPEEALPVALTDKGPLLRARALRGVGELGVKDYLPIVRKSLGHEDPSCRFWAAWSLALRTGEAPAIVELEGIARSSSPFAVRAADLLMRRLARAPALLQKWLESGPPTRTFVAAAGALGDPAFVPNLFEWMKSPPLARLAGEAFEMITGVSLFLEKLETPPPEGFESGPNDDPADPNVDLDADADLPWPDLTAIMDWWKKHQSRYAAGVRHLVGKPVSVDHARTVLAKGRQRQRIAAALELAWLNADQPLVETRAPGFRQSSA